ncbi:proline-rich protein 2-like [Solea solea]|uniref:proline-rich protein 2-like n=1 Tax=Solea solea TaxID=90069 RepID=UPI00272D7153|nr:proline-rich protein 2-like [Solea solea]
MRGESPPTQGRPEGADGDKTTDRGRNHPTPRQAAEAQGPRTQSPPAPKGRASLPPGGEAPPQTAHQGGTARYPPLPPPPPPRSRLHAPQPREGQAEAHVGPPAKGAPRDGREADSRAGPDPPGRGRASGPRARRAQPRGAPERGPPTSRSICARRRPPPGRQTAAHHSTFREVRHDEPQPCLPDTPQTERRGSDPPRPATPHGHHCCPHPDRQSQHGQGVSRNRALRSAPTTTPPHPSPPGHMPHSHPPPAKKGATRPGQGHAMASHECRRGGGPDTPTPDQKVGSRVPKARRPPACPPPCPPQGTEDAQVRPRAQQEHSSVHRPATPEGRSQGGSPPPPLGANSTPQRPAGPSAQRPRAPTPTRSAAPAQPQSTAHHPQPPRAPQAKAAVPPQIHPNPRRADPQPPRDGRPRATNPHRPPDIPSTPDARPATPRTDQGRHSHQPALGNIIN